MKTILMLSLAALLLAANLQAVQSTITEAEGRACLGDDRSRKETETAALAEAKRMAVEFAATFIDSETRVEDLVLQKDLLSAYSHAEVKLLGEPEKSWYHDPAAGECLLVKIKAEVVPELKAMTKLTDNAGLADDPAAPLQVKAWTDKKEYRAGEKIRIYLRGNKPFYARVLYRDAGGATIQLLPNPHRADHYFNGGTIYELPTGSDQFELEVAPPFGEESLIVYASTAPLGEIGLTAQGGVYQVTTIAKEIGTRTRGIKLKAKGEAAQAAGQAPTASEFFEANTAVKTGK